MEQTHFLPYIDAELKKQIARLDQPALAQFHQMLSYHMGWTGEGAGSGREAGPTVDHLLVY
jgi:hypothetical protein